MHAKMTRHRKKCFLSNMEKKIEELEADIARLKALPVVSPELTSSSTVPKVEHGFQLD